MTEEERAAEIERLQQLLESSKRAGPGYVKRIEAIKAKLAELDAA